MASYYQHRQYHKDSYDEYQDSMMMTQTHSSDYKPGLAGIGARTLLQKQQAVNSYSKGGLIAPESSSSTQRISRCTIYEDTYEESDYHRASSATRSSTFNAPNTRMSRTSRSATISTQSPTMDDYHSRSNASGNESRHQNKARSSSISDSFHMQLPYTNRETIFEALPKATCADCGEKFPFEDLVEHICVGDSLKSPLLLKGISPSISPALTPESSRSPFFDRYELNEGNKGLALQNAGDYFSHNGSRGLTEREEAERVERKRQIEAQRAAKKQALQNAYTPKKDTLQSLDTAHDLISKHRRGAGSSSSVSTNASSNIPSSSFFGKEKLSPESLTPSTSNETFASDQENEKVAKITPRKSPSTSQIDLQDLAGLVRDIEKDQVDQRPRIQGKTLQIPRRDSQLTTKKEAPIVTRSRTKERKGIKVCNVCSKEFQRGQAMVQRDGKTFCMDDYAELYLEKCRKCKEAVRTVGVRSRDGALSGLYHRSCFSCLQCSTSFDDGTFYIFENAPYCSHHYHTLNGTLCSGCNEGIEGQCRQLTESGDRFHKQCLTCQFDDGQEFCKDLLQDYYVLAGKRLCEWHFHKTVERSNNAIQKQPTPAEIRAAKRTTYVRTLAAKKGWA